ncbi:hypothetical protein PoB_005615400 [Plakobranchus ocellatus]|uniref:Uncharacterized protein n=1 Tax=Plakobranchus ocellatus TaxID=259542 RepID=A0AAV4CET0_9GAST|nr:hypothetical protein PoB_005615400 [Plakobranchus ocellatus]
MKKVIKCTCHASDNFRPEVLPKCLFESAANGKHFVVETELFRLSASQQQGDLRLSGPPSGLGADSRVQTPVRRVPADLGADSKPLCHRHPLNEASSMLVCLAHQHGSHSRNCPCFAGTG